MQFLKTFIIIYLITLSLTLEEDNPNKINSHDYEYYLRSDREEVIKNCEFDEMKAYALTGDSASLSSPNPICPNITDNCCGAYDQEKILKFWHRDRKRQEYHHKFVLKTYKWILGYGKEFYKIAGKVIEDYERRSRGDKNQIPLIGEVSNSEENEDKHEGGIKATKWCYDAAQKVVHYDYSGREKAEAIYFDLNTKHEFMENSRKGFYCVLCSVKGQEAIKTYKMFKFACNNTIYYNQQFCEVMTNWTFRSSYEMYKSFNHYLKNLLRTLTCVNVKKQEEDGKEGNFDYKNNKASEMSPELKKFIDNPLNLKSDGMETCELAFQSNSFFKFMNCRTYCNQFNIAKSVPILDGDVPSLNFLYKYLRQFNVVFSTRKKNLFRSDVVLLEKDISQLYEGRDFGTYFYKTLSKEIDLGTYETDFWAYDDAINPMEMGDQTTLTFEYEMQDIMKAWILVILGVFL